MKPAIITTAYAHNYKPGDTVAIQGVKEPAIYKVVDTTPTLCTFTVRDITWWDRVKNWFLTQWEDFKWWWWLKAEPFLMKYMGGVYGGDSE